MSWFDTTILKALPVQFIETDHCIILKRGCTELRIDGKGAADAIARILLCATKQEMTCQNICDQFPPLTRQAVREVIEQLMAKRILVSSDYKSLPKGEPENSLDIFYWHFGENAQTVNGKLNEISIDILGVNEITRQLARSFLAAGLTNFHVIDFPLLRNLHLFDDEGRLNPSQWSLPHIPLVYDQWGEKLEQKPPKCLVAASDFGGQTVFRQWNQFCIERNCHFFPITLKNLVGFLGPLVVPGETACFECLKARENSHLKDPQIEQALDQAAFQSQPFIGAYPSMSSILGEIAAFELARFYGGILPGRNVGTVLEVNLLATYMITRKVLKIPRCLVCSPLNQTAPTQLLKEMFVTTGKNL